MQWTSNKQVFRIVSILLFLNPVPVFSMINPSRDLLRRCREEIASMKLGYLAEDARKALAVSAARMVGSAVPPAELSRRALGQLIWARELNSELAGPAQEAMRLRIGRLARRLSHETGQIIAPEDPSFDGFLEGREFSANSSRILDSSCAEDAFVRKYRLVPLLSQSREQRLQMGSPRLPRMRREELRNTLLLAAELVAAEIGNANHVQSLRAFALRVGDLEAISLLGEGMRNDDVQLELARWNFAKFFLASVEYAEGDVRMAFAGLRRVKLKQGRDRAHRMLLDFVNQVTAITFLNYALRLAEAQGKGALEDLSQTLDRRFHRLALLALVSSGEKVLNRVGLEGTVEAVNVIPPESTAVRAQAKHLLEWFLHQKYELEDLEAIESALEAVGMPEMALAFAARATQIDLEGTAGLEGRDLHRVVLHLLGGEVQEAREILGRLIDNSSGQRMHHKILTLLSRADDREGLVRMRARVGKNGLRLAALLVDPSPSADLAFMYPHHEMPEPLRGCLLDRDQNRKNARRGAELPENERRGLSKRGWGFVERHNYEEAMQDFLDANDREGLFIVVDWLLTEAPPGRRGGRPMIYRNAAKWLNCSSRTELAWRLTGFASLLPKN
jgi:hypothetical protein